MTLNPDRSIRALLMALSMAVVNSTLCQNLVPNPGFEEMTIARCGLAAITKKFNAENKHWSAPTDYSPEIFSSSVDPSCWNYISKETLGTNTSTRVASILVLNPSNLLSYLQVKLIDRLEKGKVYRTEISVNIRKASTHVCNNLGLYFSDTLVQRKGSEYLPFSPQVNHANVLRDTTGWVRLVATFKANSRASYLLIGNFFTYKETIVERIREPSFVNDDAIFYYIDDVAVYKEEKKKGKR
jgi:hypothetical protein